MFYIITIMKTTYCAKSSGVTPIRPMRVTRKAANERDRTQPEKKIWKSCPWPLRRNPFQRSHLPRIPNRCCSLARKFVIAREPQETCLRTTNSAEQRARFQGNPLAGYYLTPVGRF
jgi:hypothetical protein